MGLFVEGEPGNAGEVCAGGGNQALDMPSKQNSSSNFRCKNVIMVFNYNKKHITFAFSIFIYVIV